MPQQLRIPSYDETFVTALEDACLRSGARLKFGEKPCYEPDARLTVGVNWIAGDLTDMTWRMVVWRMPHWSEGSDLELVTIRRAADHVPAGPPVMRAEGRQGLDRLCATVASLQRMDEAILAAGETAKAPPLWAFGMNKAALLLARHAEFDFADLSRTQGSDAYRNPTGGTLRDVPGNGRLQVWTRRFLVHVHEMKIDAGRRMIFRSSHSRHRNVLSIPRHPVPETFLTAMAGMDLADVVGHPAWPDKTGVRVTSAFMGQEETETGALIMALSNKIGRMEDPPAGVSVA